MLIIITSLWAPIPQSVKWQTTFWTKGSSIVNRYNDFLENYTFLGGIACSSVEVCGRFRRFLRPWKKGAITFLRNVGKLPPDCTVKQATAMRTPERLCGVQTGSGVHPASYPVGIVSSFHRGKKAGAWGWPLTSNSCRAQEFWSYICIPRVFTAQCLITHKDNYALPLFLTHTLVKRGY
jgi:hypothetical protein